MKPEGWAIQPMGSLLERVSKPVQIEPDECYTQIGVRSHGKGVFVKEPVIGEDLGNKRVFWVEPGCLVLNIVFAWEQAVALTDPNHNGMIASHRFPMYRAHRDAANVEYLRYLFLTPRGKHLLGLASPGGAGRNKTLGQKEFERLSIAVPPLPEQKKIAEILSTWDKAIETTEKLLANAEAQKKALMQQLLTGKRRLKGFEGEWAMSKLGDRITIRRGASPRPIKDARWFSDQGRGWVRISDVTSSETERLTRTEQYLSKEGAARSVAVEPGELIMSICATIGVLKIVGIPVCIHDGFVVFRNLSDRFDTLFLYYFLQLIAPRLASGGQPGTQKNLNTSIVGNILVPKIEMKEQKAIAQILQLSDWDLLCRKKQLANLKEEKRALLQQLLTGKRRVVFDDALSR